MKAQAGDLIPFFVGHECCKSGHSWGPGLRSYYLVHYIIKGKGKFSAGGKEYNLRPGQAFVIFPDDVSYYIADGTDPWEYSWIGFSGGRADALLGGAGISRESPVITCKSRQKIADCFDDMLKSYDNNPAHQLKLTGLFYIFISYLQGEKKEAAPTGSAEEYFLRAAEYIEKHYALNLSVGEIASFIGIDRKYLYQIFKKFCGHSPKESIIRFRMNKARELLENENLPVGTVAHSVGYGDALLFSKTFRKTYGKSPTEYRNSR